MEENQIIELAEKKLKDLKFTHLLIPEEIKELEAKFPNMVCNEMSENMAKAILADDYNLAHVLAELGGLANGKIYNFFENRIKKGERFLIHHFYEGKYFTTIAEFDFAFDKRFHFKKNNPYLIRTKNNGYIEFNNIIAVTKISPEKSIAERYTEDNGHHIFVRIAKKFQ